MRHIYMGEIKENKVRLPLNVLLFVWCVDEVFEATSLLPWVFENKEWKGNQSYEQGRKVCENILLSNCPLIVYLSIANKISFGSLD